MCIWLILVGGTRRFLHRLRLGVGEQVAQGATQQAGPEVGVPFTQREVDNTGDNDDVDQDDLGEEDHFSLRQLLPQDGPQWSGTV